MGKAIGGLPEAAPLAASADAEESFALGSWLAKQRELRGISREELSALTRLPIRSLERLEAGAFDGQQDGFVRGFVRTVATAIGLDPDDAVARLLAEPTARPRRRALDPRRVAVAVVGLLGAAALAAALVEWVQRTPTAPNAVAEERVLVRPDPVRALAIERGLLGDEPAGAEAAEALPFEPAADPELEAPAESAEPTQPSPELPAEPAPQ
jgi:cytoskeletal protein RodZ